MGGGGGGRFSQSSLLTCSPVRTTSHADNRGVFFPSFLLTLDTMHVHVHVCGNQLTIHCHILKLFHVCHIHAGMYAPGKYYATLLVQVSSEGIIKIFNL